MKLVGHTFRNVYSQQGLSKVQMGSISWVGFVNMICVVQIQGYQIAAQIVNRQANFWTMNCKSYWVVYSAQCNDFTLGIDKSSYL